jgi:D-alanine-D-alanine ligase
MHIAVLMGGWSAEREVSLSSGTAVAKALEENGHKVTKIDAGADVQQRLAMAKPDAVFNALHGRWGEDGCVQGLLEIMKIPYTHSGVLASAMAMDKPTAKKIFAFEGLPMAKGIVVHRDQILGKDPMPKPYVVKPINEGSSVGVSIILEGDNFVFTADNWPYGEWVLVEEYIKGREIQVAVLDGKALGAIEIKPLGRFYDYTAKYTDGQAQHLMPAPIPAGDYKLVCEYAERAHNSLGCRGLTRSDFRYDDGKFYILETNTQPGMTPLSLSPEIAAHAGITFNQLVEHLIQGATLDNKSEKSHGEKTGSQADRAREAV